MISHWEQAESGGSGMPMHVSTPDGTGPFAALVVVQHQGGIDAFMQSMTERLADAGFVAAAPDLYHRDGPECRDDIATRRSRLHDRRITTDIEAAAAFLRRQNTIDGERLAVLGFCMGGRIAYLMAAAVPKFKAAVAFYPGHAFRAWGKDLRSPFERTAEIHCPVLGHFGADDKNPSPEDMRKLDAELTRHDKVHEFYSYPNAGHAFMDHTKESYRPHAAEAAWPRTVEFLKRQLRPRTLSVATEGPP
jgi:carboxymethylenebutenolidase